MRRRVFGHIAADVLQRRRQNILQALIGAVVYLPVVKSVALARRGRSNDGLHTLPAPIDTAERTAPGQQSKAVQVEIVLSRIAVLIDKRDAVFALAGRQHSRRSLRTAAANGIAVMVKQRQIDHHLNKVILVVVVLNDNKVFPYVLAGIEIPRAGLDVQRRRVLAVYRSEHARRQSRHLDCIAPRRVYIRQRRHVEGIAAYYHFPHIGESERLQALIPVESLRFYLLQVGR